jgi:hypothetical protein
MSFLLPFSDAFENRAQIAGDIGNDIDEKGTIESYKDKISLPKIPKNHAQNDTGNDSDDGNDILDTDYILFMLLL